MANHAEIAKNRLYGEGGLGVKDFKMFPGSDRDATSEDFAEQVNKALAQIEAGDYDEVD